MTATLLAPRRVEKPWGRYSLYPSFPDSPTNCEPVGEVWFQAPDGSRPQLLVKYLFTKEKLSVQVHPDDQQARAAGLPRGKDECWVILEAERDSTIALGPKAPLDREMLRDAALDGSIEQLLDWKPVRAGDFIYAQSGTIHAIGAGITLIEIQQNCETTYRLYDYGRQRELQLDAGIAVASTLPYVPPPIIGRVETDRIILVEGPKFVVERWSTVHRQIELPVGMTGWLVAIAGAGAADGVEWRAGDCLTLEGVAEIRSEEGSDLLFAYPGMNRI